MKTKLLIIFVLSFFSIKAQINYNVFPVKDYFNGMGLCLYPINYLNRDLGIIAPDDSLYFYGLIKNAMLDLGFKNVRVPIPIYLPYGNPNHMNDSMLIRQRLKYLYDNYGIKTTLIIDHYSVAPWTHTYGLDTNRMDNASYLDELYLNGGIDYIEAVEGLNEPEHFIPDFCDPITSYNFYNTNWHKITYRVQKGLYQKCSNPPFNNIKVYAPALWKYWYATDSLRSVYPYDIENFFDYNNLHPYPGITNPNDFMSNSRLHPSIFIPLYLNDYTNITNSFGGNKPKIVTETGYVMNQHPSWNHPANIEINLNSAAKYFSFLPFEFFNNDIKKIFIFKLHHKASDPDFKQQFGLFVDNNPTPAFNTLKNISLLLADTSTISSPVTSVPLTINSFNPIDFNLRVYQQKDNQFLIAIWRKDFQSVCYDISSDNNIVVLPKSASITFQNTYDTIFVYDPFLSISPIDSFFNKSSINISITDRVLLLKLKLNNSTSISSYNKKQSNLSIYPNPFKTHLSIEFQQSVDNVDLCIFNLLGQNIKSISGLSGKTVTLNRDNLTRGVYFIHLTENNKIIGTGKIIITD